MSDFNPWHVVHVAYGAVLAVASWIAKDHFKRDDSRFHMLTSEISTVNKKLDDAIKQTSDNHSEVLKLLLDRLPAKN